MKPSSFDYVRPRDVDEAIQALAQPDARALAGGQSLVPLMNLRLADPAIVVDLNALETLERVDAGAGEVAIGALCRHRRIEQDPEIGSAVPLLAEAAGLIGHGAIRNRGTIGGSLAHGDPAAEYGAALLALGGRVRVRAAESEREIHASELFTGFLSTALDEGELLVEVIVPTRGEGEGSAFVEVAPRHGDFAVAGVAARMTVDPDGAVTAASAAACGVAATPISLDAALEPLVGVRALGDDELRRVVGGVGAALDPIADLQASADDRRELAQLLVVEALRRAWARTRSTAR